MRFQDLLAYQKSFAYECNYINQNLYDELLNESYEVVKLINFMILNPHKFGVKNN
jgi:hypothetical protein